MYLRANWGMLFCGKSTFVPLLRKSTEFALTGLKSRVHRGVAKVISKGRTLVVYRKSYIFVGGNYEGVIHC